MKTEKSHAQISNERPQKTYNQLIKGDITLKLIRLLDGELMEISNLKRKINHWTCRKWRSD
jgi:hypothetical protein